MSENEDEQLLADASTLLMFANAAARQVSPATGLPTYASNSVSVPTSAETALLGALVPSVSSVPPVTQKPQVAQPVGPSRPTLALSERASPHSASSVNSAALSYPADSTFVGLSLLGTEPQPLLPSIHQDATVPIKGTQRYHEQHPGLVFRQDHASGLVAVLPTPGSFQAHPYDHKFHQIKHDLAGEYYNSLPSRTGLTVQEYLSVANVSQDSAYRPKYRTLSPIVPNNPSDHPAQKLNLSPRFANSTVQGTLQLMHMRTASDGSHPFQTEGFSYQNSTTPTLNLALARGINVESGKRRTDNAKIAAAALAAAADIPLPLKSNPDHRRGDLDPQDLKREESVTSDFEMDDNRTDIEPESETNNSVKSEIPAERGSKPLSKKKMNTSQVRPSSASKSGPRGGIDISTAFVCPALESYKVEPDAGIIGCICEINEDDGFTIQCDICFRWQHCVCMGFKTSDEVPEDEYKCYYCDTNKWSKIDAAACRVSTIQRLENENNHEPEIPTPKRKSLGGSQEDQKKRRRPEKETKTSTLPSEKRKSSSTLAVSGSPVAVSAPAFEINNKDNPLLEDGVTAESYLGVYYRLFTNDYKTKDVKQKLEELGALVIDFVALVSTEGLVRDKSREPVIMTSSQFDSLSLCQVNLPSQQKYEQEKGKSRRSKGSNRFVVKVKLYSDNPKQKYVGISKKGLFISDSAGAGSSIPAGTPIIEYLGELDFLQLYMLNTVNQYSVWGTVKPRVVRVDLKTDMTLKSFPVVIDSRFVGNEARFIRKSCMRSANCTIRPVYITNKSMFRFLVVTTRDIELRGEDIDEELRIDWEWDDLHPIKQMLQKVDGEIHELKKFDDFDEEEKNTLVTGINTMLNFVECACNTSTLNSHCSIFKVKKATSYLMRSTRKASNLTSFPTSKSKEELVLPTNNRQFVSWQERLLERDSCLLRQFIGDSSVVAAQAEADPINERLQDIPDKQEKTIRLPPKKQLLKQSKKLVKRYEVLPESKFVVDVNANVEDFKMQKIAVPLVPEVLSNIREQVMQVLKPMTDAILVPLVVKAEVIASPETTPVPVSQENVPSAKTETNKPAMEQKPQVVKKLSFADYKKKMK